MKKFMLLTTMVCLLLTGCGESQTDVKEPEAEKPGSDVVEQEMPAPEVPGTPAEPAPEEPVAPAAVIYPLPDSTMDNLTDAILSVSLEEGDAYVDDTGKMQMDVKIYTYDLYDAVEIAELGMGDVIVTHAGEREVTSSERNEAGYICINGGLDGGGFELAPEGGGIFSEIGYSDMKSWYEVGEATIRVSVDFVGHDNADPDGREVILYPGDFLVGAVTNYDFTPHNTTIRVENGQIVELNRRYVP